MATFSTDFSAIPSGEPITSHGWNGSNWANPSLSQPSAVVAGDGPSDVGSDRYVRVTSTTSSSHQNAAWYPTAAPTGSSQMQVLVCARRSANSSALPGALGRGSGNRTTPNRQGIAGHFRNNATELREVTYVGDTPSYNDAAAALHGIDPLDWSFVLLDLNGTALKVRAWQDGAVEPSDWDIDITTAMTSAGWPGMFAHIFATGHTIEYGWFSYGTDGDAAPRPTDVAETPLDTPVVTVDAQSNPSTVGGSDGTADISWPAVSGAATYRVELDDGGGFVTVVADHGSTSYQFTGLDAGSYTAGVVAKP